jgi:DNA-binding NarL/FixJ family response regulator
VNALAPALRVVAVDDQPMFREMMRTLVESTSGFELVGESADGAAALALVRQTDPDLVILDVRMPVMDGIEAATELAAEDATRVIVLASSASLDGLSDLAAASGADALVQKQWLTPQLLRGLWIAHGRR